MRHDLRQEADEIEEEQSKHQEKYESLETIEIELPSHLRIYCSSYTLPFDKLLKRVFDILESLNKNNGSKAREEKFYG